jgi:hypothetical protein
VRSGALGQRFGHLRTQAAFGREKVFHSIMKTVVTLLENAGVPKAWRRTSWAMRRRP